MRHIRFMRTAALACGVASLLDGGARVLHAQKARAAFTVGTATAAPGTRATGVIHVPAGVDAGYDIPVLVIHGASPGPVLAVVSGAHGTEYASIVAVQELIDAVKPADLSGTLVLVPLVNVPSFEKITPHVNPTRWRAPALAWRHAAPRPECRS